MDVPTISIIGALAVLLASGAAVAISRLFVLTAAVARVAERQSQLEERMMERQNQLEERMTERQNQLEERMTERQNQMEKRIMDKLDMLAHHTHTDDGEPVFRLPPQ